MKQRRKQKRKLGQITYTSHDKERICMSERLPAGDERTDFERDRSRIIHSAAFRRLQGKTQVFTAGEGDFFRTRLTHSLEVAQIGKGLAMWLGANPELVETVSLIHDIGHPPFGHSGEEELKRLMKPYGGFEANAQNIRILTKLESKSDKYDGLNLTRATIDGQLKYKEIFDPTKRKFVYEDDICIVDWASKDPRTAVNGWDPGNGWKSFECQIMDWADEVAYAVHDLEDSIHAKYIEASTFFLSPDDSRIGRIIEGVKSKYVACAINVSEVYRELRDYIQKKLPDFRRVGTIASHKERKASRKLLTSDLIGRYIKSTSRHQRRPVGNTPISPRYFYSVCIPVRYRVEVALINRLIREFVIDSPQVRTLEEKGKHIINSLFLKFMDKDNAKYLLPDDWKGYLPTDRTEKDKARVVSDYLSGMTDDYAQRLYSKLFLPNQGSVFEVL